MKKVIVIACMAALLLSATAAMASETVWTILLRGSSPSWTFAAGLIQVGTQASAQLVKYTANTGNQAQVVTHEPLGPDTPPYYSTNKTVPITPPQTREWTLLFWVGQGYTPDTARLAWWSTSTLTMPATIGGTPYVYEIEVVRDPTNSYAVGHKWALAPGMTGTSTLPAGFADFGNVGAIKMADADAANLGVKLILRAAPIPEPGSMLVLASGLTGLVGFAVRRRRA